MVISRNETNLKRIIFESDIFYQYKVCIDFVTEYKQKNVDLVLKAAVSLIGKYWYRGQFCDERYQFFIHSIAVETWTVFEIYAQRWYYRIHNHQQFVYDFKVNYKWNYCKCIWSIQIRVRWFCLRIRQERIKPTNSTSRSGAYDLWEQPGRRSKSNARIPWS